MTTLTKIPATLETLLPIACKMVGSFDTDECLMYMEENLTKHESAIATDFLNWLNENEKTFGHNLNTVFNEFIEDNTSLPSLNLRVILR